MKLKEFQTNNGTELRICMKTQKLHKLVRLSRGVYFGAQLFPNKVLCLI